MTTSQPISSHPKAPVEMGNPDLISPSHARHPELSSGDLSRVNDGENRAAIRVSSSESDDHAYRRRNHDDEGSPA